MEKMKTEAIPFFPDEIISNILHRLPAKCAMRYRLVCKKWRDLTLARNFVDIHLRNSISTILIKSGTLHSGLDLFAIDQWWTELAEIMSFSFYSVKFHKVYHEHFSHAGIVVVKEFLPKISSGPKFIIRNPTSPSHECVTITLPRELYKSKIYGVYFHPLLNEFCALLEIKDSRDYDGEQPAIKMEYKILNLGSNPSLKTISNPCGGRHKFWYVKPLLINNYLYWMLQFQFDETYNSESYKYFGHNDVMQFDIISEEFTVIPCPIPLTTECMHHQSHVLNIDGILSIIMVLLGKIIIWRLEDHAKRLWIETEYILNIEMNHFCRADGGISVVDGKLAFLSNKVLYVCNLVEGTAECCFEKKNCSNDALFLSHQMSLASLKDCKSTIFIDKNGELVQEPDYSNPDCHGRELELKSDVALLAGLFNDEDVNFWI